WRQLLKERRHGRVGRDVGNSVGNSGGNCGGILRGIHARGKPAAARAARRRRTMAAWLVGPALAHGRACREASAGGGRGAGSGSLGARCVVQPKSFLRLSRSAWVGRSAAGLAAGGVSREGMAAAAGAVAPGARPAALSAAANAWSSFFS